MRSIGLMPPMPLAFPLKAQPAVSDASDTPGDLIQESRESGLMEGLTIPMPRCSAASAKMGH